MSRESRVPVFSNELRSSVGKREDQGLKKKHINYHIMVHNFTTILGYYFNFDTWATTYNRSERAISTNSAGDSNTDFKIQTIWVK